MPILPIIVFLMLTMAVVGVMTLVGCLVVQYEPDETPDWVDDWLREWDDL